MQQLPDAVLHKLLYEEPNAQLRALGNVRHWWLVMCDCLSCPACEEMPSLQAHPAQHVCCCCLAHSPLQISDREGSLSRTFLSPAHRRAAAQVRPLLAAALATPLLCRLPTSGSAVHAADPTHTTYTNCTPQPAQQLEQWMAAAGMRTWTDPLANVHGLAAGAGKLSACACDFACGRWYWHRHRLHCTRIGQGHLSLRFTDVYNPACVVRVQTQQPLASWLARTMTPCTTAACLMERWAS